MCIAKSDWIIFIVFFIVLVFGIVYQQTFVLFFKTFANTVFFSFLTVEKGIKDSMDIR